MTDLELLRIIARREERGLSTSRVTMSRQDASELSESITGKRHPGEVEPGAFGNVFRVDIWVDADTATGWDAE